ncbi:hypothetical protein BG74_07800, partial [Sodalis-like endosymbiont of Proechinophthirus fluctus]
LEGNDLVLMQGAGTVGKIARKLADSRLQPHPGEGLHG